MSKEYHEAAYQVEEWEESDEDPIVATVLDKIGKFLDRLRPIGRSKLFQTEHGERDQYQHG
jgi:hypothetical protein